MVLSVAVDYDTHTRWTVTKDRIWDERYETRPHCAHWGAHITSDLIFGCFFLFCCLFAEKYFFGWIERINWRFIYCRRWVFVEDLFLLLLNTIFPCAYTPDSSFAHIFTLSCIKFHSIYRYAATRNSPIACGQTMRCTNVYQAGILANRFLDFIENIRIAIQKGRQTKENCLINAFALLFYYLCLLRW